MGGGTDLRPAAGQHARTRGHGAVDRRLLAPEGGHAAEELDHRLLADLDGGDLFILHSAQGNRDRLRRKPLVETRPGKAARGEDAVVEGIGDQQDAGGTVRDGIFNLFINPGGADILVHEEGAGGIVLARPPLEHEDDLILDLNAGIVVISRLRIGDPVAGEDDLAAAAFIRGHLVGHEFLLDAVFTLLPVDAGDAAGIGIPEKDSVQAELLEVAAIHRSETAGLEGAGDESRRGIETGAGRVASKQSIGGEKIELRANLLRPDGSGSFCGQIARRS